MLDYDKLPITTTAEKAFRFWDSIQFGTLFVRGKSVPREDWCQNENPQIREVFKNRYEFGKKLPEGYKGEFIWYSDDYGAASFLSYIISVPIENCPRVFKGKNGIPWQIGYMLADYLQLGGHFNFRNFNNYRYGANLKFLPFTLNQGCIQFHVYPLTLEEMEKGLGALMLLAGELKRIFGSWDKIEEVLKYIYGLVRLDEVRSQSKYIQEPLEDIQKKVNKILLPHKKTFGYLYKELKGSQDARRFYYEMLAKK